MEVSSSLPESAPQSESQPQSQSESQPRPQQPPQSQPQLQSQPQQQHPDQNNPQIHDQSQQYAQQPGQIQDYYYQNPGQAYDQAYYNYYQQYAYQNQWQYPQQPPNYDAYYQQPDYSAAYTQPLAHQPTESAPGVSAPYEIAADAGGNVAAPVQVHQQQLQHHQHSAYPPVQSSVNAVVPPGMNPAAAAAIAALQQLTQFEGTMDAAERAMAGIPAYNPSFGPVTMRPPDARYPQRGRGRRGGGWMNVGHRNGSAPPSRGRGRGRGPRGRGRSRHFQGRGAPSSSSYPEPSAVIGDAAQSAPAPENVAPNHRQVQIAWCELCRVDCTSLEILEQHKNGKRHKKNLLRFEELKNKTHPGGEIPSEHVAIIDSKPDTAQQPPMDQQPQVAQETQSQVAQEIQPQVAQEIQPQVAQEIQPQVAQDIEGQKAVETLPSESTSNEPTTENNLQNDAAKLPEVPAEASDQQEKQPVVNQFENRRQGLKRKMKGGRGAKRMKTSDSRRRPIEPPKPKVVIPLICDLCNVKCDTREVLDRHLSGKKHIAKLKRYEGHQAMYGSQGLQMLYPPNPIAQTHFIAQGQQPLQPFYGPMVSFPPQGVAFSSQPHQPTAGLDPQVVSQSIMPQVPEAIVTVEPNPTSAV